MKPWFNGARKIAKSDFELTELTDVKRKGKLSGLTSMIIE